jgi:transcriptional regulator with XRE-family HTH domain
VQRGLSLEELAVLANVHKSTVSRIERGLVEPGPETVVAIARALGVSAARMRRLTRGRPSIALPNGDGPSGAREHELRGATT